MASEDALKPSNPTTSPPPIAAPPPSAAAAADATAERPPHIAPFAFVFLAALMSVVFYVEPFVAAAAELRLPWPVVVVTLVFFAAFFCASALLFGSFFLPRLPPAAAAAAQWEGIGAIAVAVGVGVVACLVAAGGSAYGTMQWKRYPMHTWITNLELWR
ncbi:uncharacterized protein LOC133901988 [Phragmites australis]|uniref:uncharacterized protein LOC133901988 n=1 Tax=Phragmites australis TaxID=29695 RepID=UPI002D7682BA|nr:uncharacterized protein LOC133901988 [Phragmites australis]